MERKNIPERKRRSIACPLLFKTALNDALNDARKNAPLGSRERNSLDRKETDFSQNRAIILSSQEKKLNTEVKSSDFNAAHDINYAKAYQNSLNSYHRGNTARHLYNRDSDPRLRNQHHLQHGSYSQENKTRQKIHGESSCRSDRERSFKPHNDWCPRYNEKYNTEPQNHKFEKKDYNEQKFVKASIKLSSSNEELKKFAKTCKTLSSSDEEFKNCYEYDDIKCERKVSKLGEGFRVTVQSNQPSLASFIDVSKIADLDLPTENQVNLESESTISEECAVQNACFLGKENFIPPPVQPVDIEGRHSLSKRNLDSAVETLSPNESEVDESLYMEPDDVHIEAITQYIFGIVKEKSVSCALADKVVSDLNRIFKYYFEGNKIDVYGSYYCGLAITTSDINLVMISDCAIKKSFMREIHKVLSNELKQYRMHAFEEGSSTTRTKVIFSDPVSGICCRLAYLGRQEKRIIEMGKYLKRVCSYDSRVKTLITAAKIWAEICLINEFEDGKLHPVGFALMMVHFLQQYEVPILPLYSDKGDESPLLQNDISVGKLWINFLKYYALKFDWKSDVVSVNCKECVSRQSKGWNNYWIAIEDPFSDKNIADTVVNSDVADYIKACFKASYEYFLTPPDNSTTSSADEDSCSNEVWDKWPYSFHLCTVDNSDAFCDACDEIGDTCEDCKKKNYIPPSRALPEMTDDFLKQIGKVLYEVYDKYMLTDEEVLERKMFVNNLQEDVKNIYPESELKLFGSSSNGFGFKNSDLDICMAIEEQKNRDPAIVLKNLRNLLQRKKGFNYVCVIYKAHIPIIKFHYQPKGWRGDISINNILAVHNSNLLYTYSIIDERCKILGCALKLLAKKALIAEVTDKALSSYSYLVMIVHFLQQTDPPVLPVLQDPKLREKDNYQLKDIVEDWNVWYCKDLKYVEKVYKDIYGSKNETKVEQIWLDLLNFYCSYESNRIITIRQRDPLYLGENQHSARFLNIQDPFIVNKNLGRVVSSSKAQEAESVFHRARLLFGTPVDKFPSSIRDAEDYFFSTMSLTGKIQKEAHCNLCGKFGHETKDCKHSHFLNKRNLFKRHLPRKYFRKEYTMHQKQTNKYLQR